MAKKRIFGVNPAKMLLFGRNVSLSDSEALGNSAFRGVSREYEDMLLTCHFEGYSPEKQENKRVARRVAMPNDCCSTSVTDKQML
jgi:hypothetical protein